MKHIYQVMESGEFDDYLIDIEVDEDDEQDKNEKKLYPKGELLQELSF